MNSELPFAEACERNKTPILNVLKEVLPARGLVLEVGSGTGQHVVHFAPHFPLLTWQPTERKEYLEGLRARISLEGGSNILPPVYLNVLKLWPDRNFEAAFSSNTAHIMGWGEVCRLFYGIGARLGPAGVFCLYGPFNEDGRFTSPSNADFDQQLRQRDPVMGLRDIEELDALARENQMRLQRREKLPANNQLLIFGKSGG